MATAAAPTREDTWLITLTIEGSGPGDPDRDMGVWDTFDGGEADSDDNKYRPGGMAAEISLGGTITIGNITVSRMCDRVRDWPQIKWMMGRVGKARIVLALTPLDLNGARNGSPLTYTGTLKTVTPPTVDSTGGDAAMLEVECTIDGSVA